MHLHFYPAGNPQGPPSLGPSNTFPSIFSRPSAYLLRRLYQLSRGVYEDILRGLPTDINMPLRTVPPQVTILNECEYKYKGH